MLSATHLKQQAAELGFSACGLAPAAPVDPQRAAELKRWLAEGCQADMHYLENNLDKRLNPCLLVEGAKTVVSLAVNYYSHQVPPATEPAYRLARYAYGTDYHEVVKQMLRRLMQRLRLEEGRDGRVFVDTAPIDEKYWAQQCGLGWCGRHSQLILPQAGSYYFLGELVLVHPADAYDAPMRSHCGNCRRCIEACPTGALRGDGTLDARRCLSYLTIEHRGPLPPEAAGSFALFLRLRPLCRGLSLEPPLCLRHPDSRLAAPRSPVADAKRGLESPDPRTVPPALQKKCGEKGQI